MEIAEGAGIAGATSTHRPLTAVLPEVRSRCDQSCMMLGMIYGIWQMLGAVLMLQEDLALIEKLLCCDALHPQAVNGCLPGLQRPSAYGCFLSFWGEVMTMLAQHALCNIQDEALCN